MSSMTNARDKWIQERRQLLEKKQCNICHHWRLFSEIYKSGECEDCHEEEDQEPYLWADWRQRCTL